MDVIIDIFNKCKDYCLQNPLMAAIAAGALVFLIILLIVIGSLTKKAKQTEKLLAEQAAAKTAAETPAEEVAATKEVANEPVEVPAKESAPAELATAPATEMVEEKSAPAPVEELAEEKVAEKVEETTPEEETPAEEVSAKEEVAPAESGSANALADELNATQQKQDFYEEYETDKHARYAGKWVICKIVSDDLAENEEIYFFELHASNGEKLFTSEEYTSYNGVLRGIQTHKTNILKNNFKITLSKKGDYIFKLLSGKNMLLCMGENYSTRARCESAIQSTKRFAATAVVDENVQELIVKIPKESDTEITPLPEGYNGKWIIDTITGADGETLYYFELFANNGEKLLSSEEYTTYIGAVNGIETHKKNIDNNNFRISLTKRGDYIFKLLNGNGQLLCLGEHYKTRRLCQNAVDSVKRFAPNSPTLIDSSLTKPKI